MKKHVVIVSCVFPPEPLVSAHTSAQIANELARAGQQVKVIAPFPSRPSGKIDPQYKWRLLKREFCPQGYEIIRCFSFYSSVSSLLSRFLENMSFGLSVFIILLFSSRADIVYGNTWPIFAQGLLMLACKLRCIPLILSIQDLYPESLFVQKRGFERTSRSYALLRWLDILIAKNSRSLIVISEQFKRTYMGDRGIEEGKILVVPNWVDQSNTLVDHQSHSIRQKHNIPNDAFLIVYGGTIGRAAGVDMVIQAFEYFKNSEKIYLLIAGEGSMLDQCRTLAKASGNAHVVFHNPWPANETSSVLGAADLLILPTQGNQSLASVPSKLISYMFAARPVLASANLESEIARTVMESGAGWVVSTTARAISQKVKEISEQNPDRLRQCGLAGRAYALQHYSMQINVSKITERLLK